MTDPLLAALTECVGDQHVLADADMRAGYEVDWTRRFTGQARCVVRPADTAEVSAVVRACAEHGAPIVPQGGNTGMVGGGVPRGGEVVLSMRRLDRLGPVDHAAMQVSAGAGVTLERLQHHARAAGVDFAVDFGARASATVGGAISTNAGGSRVVRFGTMRSQVADVRVVLADGSVVGGTAGLPKATAGLHLPSLFCGAEGTLGIVTEARLRLVPWFRERVAAWVGVSDVANAVAVLERARSIDGLDAAELLFAGAVALGAEFTGTAAPTWPEAAAYVLVDFAGDDDPSGDVAAALSMLDVDGVLAAGAQRQALFDLRDHMAAAISGRGVPLKLDVAVPIGELSRLVDAVDAVAQRFDVEAVVFGHLAEGNLHVNILGAGDNATAITDAVLGTVIELRGTISAEHGIGVAKAAWLERARGSAEAQVLRAVKAALDPANLLNPGVLLPTIDPTPPPPRPSPTPSNPSPRS